MFVVFCKVMALAILWVLKSTKASLIFPLMVLALVGFRKCMDYTPKIFSQRDLYWLDNLMPASHDKKDQDGANQVTTAPVASILNYFAPKIAHSNFALFSLILRRRQC
jgi:hypothetical protein